MEPEVDKEDTEGGLQNQKPNPNQSEGSKGKSCKGCLYYSSLQKSKSKKPTCVGLSQALQVPRYVVGETELEASREGRSLADFKYACLGYSVYVDKNNSSSDQQNKQAELPFCVGLEILLDRRPADHAPAHVPKEDAHALPQPQSRTYKPAHHIGEEYLNRFKRNAGLVASGVARNVNRVCIYVKDSLDDILYPYRRRPK
ncbi:hypothetical protein F2P56_036385 [Juglans regia]|uniref:Uncharacterized protein LOC109006530 isoform X1 n=2 Tax=Juglans regia TaxID=51240 RepID=A0A2I4GBU2_JUGRE|nr:uncharacterized protein LOC109006530 isoform X1 [Juglans regia]KAF5443861.1 hypothetical protein F2P56_036385 [Juglans regia]